MAISRRNFLSLCGAAAAVPAFGAAPAATVDPNRVVLFSDNHLAGKVPGRHQNVEMEKAVKEVLQMRPLPGNLFIYGDLAWACGVAEDYRLCRAMQKPLQDAGIKVSLALGNHDRHDPFFAEFPEYLNASKVRKGSSPLFDSCPDNYRRMVSVVETPYADFILLDSCLDGPVPGAIDAAQLQWLEQTVKNAKKPFIVGSHHPIYEVELGPLLAASPFCAGYIHGHDHFWQTREYSSRLPILCLPSLGYWGDIGYCVMQLNAHGAVVQSHITKLIDNTEKEVTEEERKAPFGTYGWRVARAASYTVQFKNGCTWRIPWKKES